MTDPNRAREIAESVATASPIPERLSDLDAHSRRKITRQAEALGITPEKHYAAIVAAEKAKRASTFDPGAIAKKAHRG
ncbi:hypothetical protein [Diaminobutyricimonas sp. TR449]|uniref:hypothetical protein n=1 Tax=Diaminobutyricimonas sp. TR449 TaxID=2708076 RepID=UPI00142040C4|nr:hypothetical protein [Diaminobutyricimonas sp. TR449]